MSHARNKTENSSICKGKGENNKQKSTKEKKVCNNLITDSKIEKKNHASKEKEKKKIILSLKKPSVTRNKKMRKTENCKTINKPQIVSDVLALGLSDKISDLEYNVKSETDSERVSFVPEHINNSMTRNRKTRKTENCKAINRPQIVSNVLSPCLSDKISDLDCNITSETDSERVSPVREHTGNSAARNKKVKKTQNCKNVNEPQIASEKSPCMSDKISDSDFIVVSEADSEKVYSTARNKKTKKPQNCKNMNGLQIASDNSPCMSDKISDSDLIVISEADSERQSPVSKQNSHCNLIPKLCEKESILSTIKNTVSAKKLHSSCEAESQHVIQRLSPQKPKCNVSVIDNVSYLNITESGQFADCYSATLPDMEINYETDSDLMESDSIQNTVIDNSVFEQSTSINRTQHNIPNDYNVLKELSVPENYLSPKKCFISLMNQKNSFIESKQNFICNELKIEPIIKPVGFNYEQNNPFSIAVDISMVKAAYDYINENSKSAAISAVLPDISGNEWQDGIVKSSDIFFNFSGNESQFVSEDESEVSISSCKTADIQPEFFDSTFSENPENVSFSQEILDYAINDLISPIATNINEMCSVSQSQPFFEHLASKDDNDEKCINVKPIKRKRKRRSQFYYSRKRRCRKVKQDAISNTNNVTSTEFCDTCDEDELQEQIAVKKGQSVNEDTISESNMLNTEFCGTCDKSKMEESTHEHKKCQKVIEDVISESNNVLSNELCDESEVKEPINVQECHKVSNDVFSESNVLHVDFCDTFDPTELEKPIDSISPPNFSHTEMCTNTGTEKPIDSISPNFSHTEKCTDAGTIKLPEKVTDKLINLFSTRIPYVKIKRLNSSVLKNHCKIQNSSHAVSHNKTKAIKKVSGSSLEASISQAESHIAHSQLPSPKNINTSMENYNNLSEAVPSQTESLIVHSHNPSSRNKKVIVESNENLTEESVYKESLINAHCDVSSDKNTKAIMVIHENSHEASLSEVESLVNDNCHFSSPKSAEAIIIKNCENSTEESRYQTASFIAAYSPSNKNTKVIVKTDKNSIEASLSQSESFNNVNFYPSSPKHSELSDDHITEAVVLGVSDDELDFEPDHPSDDSTDGNAFINNPIICNEQDYFNSIPNSVIENHLEKVTKANLNVSDYNATSEKNKALYSSVCQQKDFRERHERDATPFEDDSESDEDHSFKRSHYEQRNILIQENNLVSLKINQENVEFSEQNNAHLSDGSHSRNSDEIAHHSVTDQQFKNCELLKSVEEQSIARSYVPSNSSESKVSHDHLHDLKNVVRQINEYCYKQMGSEAVNVAQTYIPISSSADTNTFILKKLLHGIFSFIVKPDNDDTSISNIFDDILNLMHKFDIYNKQISSYFIVKCCEHPILYIFSEKMLNSCQQKKIPLNSKAIKAFSSSLKLEEIQFSELLKYLYYIKSICKKRIPKELMHLALEKSKTWRNPESHHLCSLLCDTTSKEVNKFELKEFLQMCFKRKEWPYIADMFLKWHSKNSLSLCIYTALASEHECIGEYYQKFADAVHSDDKPLHPEQKILFGQIGIALMLEAFSKKQMESALEILNILHEYNINYYESQLALHKLYSSRCVDQSDNFDVQTLPFSVVFTAVDICLHFKRPKDAFTIFQDFSWVNPDENLSEAVKTYILKERYHRLLKLVPLLNNEDTLHQGWEAFKILLTAIEQDLVDLNEESLEDQNEVVPKENLEVSDSVQKPLIEIVPNQKLIPKKKPSPIQSITSIYNEYLISLINSDEISSALDLYQHSLGPKKEVFAVETNVLRGLVVSFSNHDMTKEADSVFMLGLLTQVYSIKKPKRGSFPWDLTIRSEWTVPEIKLVIEWFAKTLFPLLSNKPKETKFENWFSIKILFKVISATKSKIHCLSETNVEPNYYISKTKDALQNMNPCLVCNEEIKENTLLITSESLYNYWINNCPDASPKFPSSGRPPLETKKKRLPFGASNDSAEKETSVSLFSDEGNLNRQLHSPHKPHTLPTESSELVLMQMINDIRNKDSYSPVSPKTSPHKTCADLQNDVSAVSCLMTVSENSSHMIRTNTPKKFDPVSQVKMPIKVEDIHNNKHKIHNENNISTSPNYVMFSSDLNESQSEVFITNSPKTDSVANNSSLSNEPCFREKDVESVIKPLDIISSNKLSPQKMNFTGDESLKKKTETPCCLSSHNPPIVFAPGTFKEPTIIRNKKVRQQMNKLNKRQNLYVKELQLKKAIITPNAKRSDTPKVKNKTLVNETKVSDKMKKLKKCNVNTSNKFENFTVSVASNTSTRIVSNCSPGVNATSCNNKINSQILVQIPAGNSNSIFEAGSSNGQEQSKFHNCNTVVQNALNKNKPNQLETKLGSQLVVVTDPNVKRPIEILKEPLTVSVTSSSMLFKPKEFVPNEKNCRKDILPNKVTETAVSNNIPVENTSNKNILLYKVSETEEPTIIPLQKKCTKKIFLKKKSEITAPNNVPDQRKFYKPVLKRNYLAGLSEKFNQNKIKSENATNSSASINNISPTIVKRGLTVTENQKLPDNTVSLNSITNRKSFSNSSCNPEELNKIIQFLEIKIRLKYKNLTPEEHHQKAISLAQAFIMKNKAITKLDTKAMKNLVEFQMLNV